MKPEHLKHSFFKRLSLRESWIIFFILGIIMLNYPFIHIFNKHVTFMSIPLLYFYIIGGWFVSILVILLFTRSIKPESSRDDGSTDK